MSNSFEGPPKYEPIKLTPEMEEKRRQAEEEKVEREIKAVDVLRQYQVFNPKLGEGVDMQIDLRSIAEETGVPLADLKAMREKAYKELNPEKPE